MNRTRAAAVAIATVVGTVGGAGSAVLVSTGGGTTSSEQRAVDPAGDPSGRAVTGPAPEPLFFSMPQVHDGEEVVPIDADGRLAREFTSLPAGLTRRDGGYLVSVSVGVDGGEDLWTVARDGAETRVATVAPGWDVDPGGTRVVGHDLEEDRLTVWDTATGEVLARWGDGYGDQDSAAFGGDDVLVSSLVGPADHRLLRWDVAAGTTTDTGTDGYADMGASPDGAHVAGRREPGGGSGEQSACLGIEEIFLGGRSDAVGQTCELQSVGGGRPSFSPDGSRRLTVPASTGGAEISELVVVDVAQGPEEPVARFDLPPGSIDATWLGDDAVLVTGLTYSEYDASKWLVTCDLEGTCSEEDVPGPGEIVLGKQR